MFEYAVSIMLDETVPIEVSVSMVPMVPMVAIDRSVLPSVLELAIIEKSISSNVLSSPLAYFPETIVRPLSVKSKSISAPSNDGSSIFERSDSTLASMRAKNFDLASMMRLIVKASTSLVFDGRLFESSSMAGPASTTVYCFRRDRGLFAAWVVSGIG